MVTKKSEPVRNLRSRSITRAGGEGISSPTATSTPAIRSPGRARTSDRSPARATRAHSPARGKLETSPISSSRKGNSSTKSPTRTPPRQTPPRQTRTSSSGLRSPARPETPTRQSTRQAEKSHLTARISPVSSGPPRYVAGATELPPTPTEEDFMTDKNLQKIVDEYLSEGRTGSKKKQVKVVDNKTSGLLEAGKRCLSVVGRIADGLLSLAVLLSFIFGAFFLTLACDMKSCKLTSFPRLPRALKSYFDLEAAIAVTAWLAAAVLLSALPLSRKITRTNHAGIKHSYRCNGLSSLIVLISTLAAAYAYNVPVYAFISERLLQIVVTLYIYAVLLSFCLYLKGRNVKPQALSPFTQKGGAVKRFLLGRETSPTFFGVVDVKSLLVVQVAYLTWLAMETVIVMEAFQRGRIDPGVIVVAACQALYTIDMIMFEHGLSTTMLMTTEGLGLGMIIQCLVFVPVIQTSILRYLILQPTSLITYWTHPAIAATAIIFLIGYVIYRGSSYQKYSYRTMPHHPGFLGLELIPSPSGKSLLCGGSWWSLCRHPNHLGTVIMVVAISIPCGLTCLMTYIYSVVMILGVVMREREMESLCESKHGKAWQRYTQAVRSKLIPYLY